MTTFIDSHCHLFNVTDVPLYEALRGRVNMGTVKKFFSVMASGAVVLAKLDDNLLFRHRNFIRFFEREQQQNIEWLAKELRTAVTTRQPDTKLIVITPLIMDFDMVHTDTDIGGDVTVIRQFERLKQAIVAAEENLRQTIPVKVFPFMGFDMNKLVESSTALEKLQEFWSEHAAKQIQIQNGDFAAIDNGTVLGLKLYPPLGFNPYPNNKEEKIYLKFYKWCVNENIPITVHCQPSSFTAMQNEKTMEENTDSANWLRLFKKFPELHNLHVNFAHFGGEAELAKALKGPWDDEYGYFNPDRVNTDTWVGRLLRLLKEYPNTYADVSAFEFSDDAARANLAKLLDLEKSGKLNSIGGGNLLKDKLLWGSDVPMIISADPYLQEKYHNDKTKMGYQYLLANFQRMVDEIKTYSAEEKQQFIAALTQNNPTRFLLRLRF